MTEVREVALPYRSLFGDPKPRPYLGLRLTGINGESGDVWGVVDSGADITSLPVDFASLMGYDASSLTHQDGLGAGGTIKTWVAHEPSRAYILGWEEVEFEISPMFIEGGEMPLWGRGDVFRTFHVLFQERDQEFVLTLP